MFHLPVDWLVVLQTFAPLFSAAVRPCAQRLLLGAILAPGKRTISSILRVLGAGQAPRFQNYHRVLNRATWSARQGARLLLGLLVASFAPTGPLVFGLDETIERKRPAECLYSS